MNHSHGNKQHDRDVYSNIVSSSDFNNTHNETFQPVESLAIPKTAPIGLGNEKGGDFDNEIIKIFEKRKSKAFLRPKTQSRQSQLWTR